MEKVSALAIGLILTGLLSGCGGPSLSGQTYYSISAINGDETSISFDGEAWQMSDGDNWYSGTWMKSDNGYITLAEAHGDFLELSPIEDSDGYQYVGKEKLGTRFYPSREEAEEATNAFIEALPNTVEAELESADWEKNVSSSASSCEQPETISFSDGKADFTRGSYTQNGYIFRQGPNAGDWAASDHSGKYTVTVDDFSRVVTSNNPQYSGTLTIDGAEITYKLETLSEHSAFGYTKKLTLDNNLDLVFTTN